MSTFPEEQLDSPAGYSPAQPDQSSSTTSTSTKSKFPEEQFDSPVGYFPAQPGQSLNGGRWTIIRKLGWGPRSSTWLALDNEESIVYHAIKIFTTTATEDSTGNNERYILSLDSMKDKCLDIPELLSYFYEHDSKGKKHLCLEFRVFGISIEDLRLTNIHHGENLPVHVVQSVALRISTMLAHLAGLKIIHGAVTPDNFLLFAYQSGPQILEKVLKRSKRPEIQNIVGSDGITYPSVISQPFPALRTWNCSALDMECAGIDLTNFAYARPIGGPAKSHSPRKYYLNFVAPEVLQNKTGRIDTKSDVWMFGCSMYLLLTGSPLFSDSYIASPIETAREALGKLESLLAQCGNIAEKDIPPAASFLRSCLMIKPSDRASAWEICNGSWVLTSY